MNQGSPQKKSLQAGSAELVEQLVTEHAGWASAIARSVARAWNLDWQLDGLDGGAYEALVFCARRFDPALGVPFRAYARRRIHEASTEEARNSKSWKKSVGANTEEDQASREISASLFQIYPELREGLLPISEATAENEDSMRSSIRQLLASASVLATLREMNNDAENVVDYRKMLECVALLEPVHQAILWEMYWQGKSMRNLAEEWKIDELNIVREHKAILEYICDRISKKIKSGEQRLKVRPGLRMIAQLLKRNKSTPPFSRFQTILKSALVLFLVCRFGL